VLGLVQQAIGPGVVVPLYLASQTGIPGGTPAPFMHGAGMVLSMLASYLLPLALMALPAPVMVSAAFKQQVIALWQAWPLAFTIAMSISCSVLNRTRPTSENAPLALAPPRAVYSFACVCSSLGHTIALAASITSLVQLSVWPSPNLADLHPRRVWIPVLYLGSASVPSVEEGILQFLKWDYAMAALATLVWSVHLHVRGAHRRGISIDGFQLAWKTLLWTVVDGPSSAAIRLIWEWEESVSHCNECDRVQIKQAE
jgi:hypothetical protein